MGLWQPHDNFFKALMEQRRAVTALLRERLPPELVAQLADTPPELVDGSFVDGELRGSISDRLFRLKLRGKGEAFVYCVLEHKSSPEPRVALKLLGYMVRGWERLARQLRGTDKLPLIIPMVVYHGVARWKVPASFSGLVQRGPLLSVKPLDFEMVLVNLEAIDDSELSNERTLRAGLLTLKYATREKMQLGRLKAVLEALELAPSLLRAGLVYMVETYQRIDRAVLFGEARRAMPEHQEEIMTIAQELREEGRKKGRAEGRAEGQQLALLRILGRRFGRIPKTDRARVMEAKPSELDRWLDHAVDAPTLQAVFGRSH